MLRDAATIAASRNSVNQLSLRMGAAPGTIVSTSQGWATQGTRSPPKCKASDGACVANRHSHLRRPIHPTPAAHPPRLKEIWHFLSLLPSWRVRQDELFDVSGDTGRTVRAGHPNRIRTKEPTLLIEKGKIRRSVFPPL